MDNRAFRPWACTFASLLFVSSPAAGQLFESLEAFGNRLDVGLPSTVSWGRGPKGIATGDLNGDGQADLAASNLDGSVTAYLSLSGGGFSPPIHLPTLLETLRGIAIADMDGDGRNDIAACAPYDGQLVVFRNAAGPDLAFQQEIVPTWVGARNLAAGDFDDDGRTELVVAGPGLGLRQYRRTPAGDYEAVANVTELDAGLDELPKPVS